MNNKISTKNIALTTIVIIIIAIGWHYPILGYIVPVVMITALIISLFNGRYHCGNICPRGVFFNTTMKNNINKRIPDIFKNMTFRIAVMIALMGFMLLRIPANYTSINHIGNVFWSMCVITTAIGIVLGLMYKPRTWCTFCPIGTIQNIIGKKNKLINIDNDVCVDRKLCQKTCPINIPILDHKESKKVSHKDCLKCSVCVDRCPKGALSMM